MTAAVDHAAKRVQAEAPGPHVPQAVPQDYGREHEQDEDGAKKVDHKRMEIGPEQADQDHHDRAHHSGEHDEPYAPEGARYSTDPSQRS
jgi:hypothetical protein